MSAVLLFDQINIQRGLANGLSLDDIATSGTDPTAPFTPKRTVLIQNGLWSTSLTLSLMTAFVAMLVDACYSHYLSPIPGQPKVRARTRHLRYKGLIKWRLGNSIGILQMLLYFSLITFMLGLYISSWTQGSVSAYVVGVIYILSIVIYGRTCFREMHHPEYPWKTPLTSNLSSASRKSKITSVPGLTSSLEVKSISELNTVQASEIYAAHESRIENEVDALLWLYKRSSTSAIHRLVIQALAGLSPDYIARAKAVFSWRWVEIRDEKERMLMDCMELSRDGPTRWIPKDIPNIDRRIEPLLRLEILFPGLRREFPSGLFGEHNLDFSKRLSNTFLVTLSSIDDAHIQKPTQNQVIMDALADNGVHHPLVWAKLLDCYADKEKLIHGAGHGFTIEMCLNLVTSIYLPKDSPPESYSYTLAYALVTFYKKETLIGLLAFFSTSEPHNDLVDHERRLPLAIVRALAPDSEALSTFNSHQRHRFHDDSTISKYGLLRVALHVIHKDIHHPVNPPSKQWRTDVFWAILSFIMSDFFTGCSLSNPEYSEFKHPFWTCRAYALACMASLMGGGRESCDVEWKAEWATKPLFLNILRVIHDERVADAPPPPAIQAILDPPRVDSIIGVVGWLLCQAFKRGIPGAYEAFRENGSLGYIAKKSSLHLELIEGLRGYITGLSDAKTGKFPRIQSDEFPDRHIQDLHRAPVIRCICASIVRSVTPPRPFLSSLTSIAPHDDKWPNILQTLNSLDDEYRDSVQCYTLHPTDNGTPNDLKRWKKDMKEIVLILAKCLEVEKGSNIDINQVCR